MCVNLVYFIVDLLKVFADMSLFDSFLRFIYLLRLDLTLA